MSGATIIERPIEKTSNEGRSSDQYENPGCSRITPINASPAMNGPTPMNHRGPYRIDRRPTRGDSKNITTVMGRRASPLRRAV